ncbi:MAG: HAD family hydrolase [Pirellulales bacterium]
MPIPSFFYFDLGNVLLFFDHQRGCRQMGEVAGVDLEQVWQVLYESGLATQYETGLVTTRQMFDTFCQQTDSQPDYNAFVQAAGDIFEVNASIKPVVAGLISAGHRLGLLSNTCEAHWNWFASGRYGQIPDGFEQIVLSYEARSMKPDAKIFRVAAEKAGVPPSNIFYTDDTPGHVQAAKALGFDAVHYTNTPALVAELRQRGVEFNY